MIKGTTRSNLFFFLLLLYNICVSFFLFGFTHYDTYSTPVKLFISQSVTLALPFLAFMFISKQKFTDLVPLKKVSIENIVLIVVMCILIQPFMSFCSALSSVFFTDSIVEMVGELNSIHILIAIFCVGVLPAICEEFVMRGAILSGYKYVSIKKAAIINGLLFGMLHFNGGQFLYAAFLGAIFCYFVYYTGSIFASVIGHFVINASQFMLFKATMKFGMDLEVAKGTLSMAEKISAIEATAVMALIFTPIFLLVFNQFKNLNKKNISSAYYSNLTNASVKEIFQNKGMIFFRQDDVIDIFLLFSSVIYIFFIVILPFLTFKK